MSFAYQDAGGLSHGDLACFAGYTVVLDSVHNCHGVIKACAKISGT